MTDAADLILTNAEVHTLVDGAGETHEAVALRDGEVARVDTAYEVDFLNGVDTEVVDLDGRVVLPGFVDAHTHLEMAGRFGVHADLRGASGPDECVDRLRAEADGLDGWVLGFGFDESTWAESRYLTRDDLDRVSTDRPVAAVREDMHTAAVNGVVLDRYGDDMPAEDVETEDGEPTGVVVEEAVDVLWEAIEPTPAETRDLLLAAQAEAHRLGVTGVHDMVRRSHAPAVYRQLALDDQLRLRVRLNYWSDHLDAVTEAGLQTNHGDGWVEMGGIKTFTDGSLGGRTARLSEPYADLPDDADAGDGRGQWVVPPEDLHELVEAADDADLQVTAHAIGDEAVEAVLDAYEATGDPGAARHRVEHAIVATDEQIDRFADLGVVASMQPNFLKWNDAGGLYEARLGPERRQSLNRFPTYLERGAPLAFGSDCMPMDPLLGVHHAVNAPTDAQRLSVTEALRAYTLGAAYAGFDEHRRGTVETGKQADLVVLERSPWDHPESIRDIDVAMTVVAGDVVYDGRNG